jgi:hypothetical protein
MVTNEHERLSRPHRLLAGVRKQGALACRARAWERTETTSATATAIIATDMKF